MNILTLDIETIPTQRADVRNYFAEKIGTDTQAKLADLRAPSNYKDEAKIAEYIENARRALLNGEESAIDAEVGKTGLEGAFGQIVCICWAWDDGAVQSAYATDTTAAGEASVIGGFFADVNAKMMRGAARARIVGHNVAAFDLRFLRQRAIVNGMRPPVAIPFDAKPWDEAIYDTMIQWAGVGKTISMDKLCLALGIDGKGGISGADVWPMVQAGKFAEVRDYCVGDVERTRAIYRRMTFAEAAESALADPPAVDVFAAAQVPQDYMRTPEPPPPEPDKKRIAEALKAGEDVPGCALSQSYRIDIK